MKKLMLLLLVGILYISCKEHTDPEPYTNIVTVVKLKDPTWRNYIISSMYPDKSRIGAAAYNVVGDSVRTPYRELPNNYLLVDWRWYRFPENNPCLVFEPWDNYTGFYYFRNSDSVQYQLHPLQCYFVDMAKVNAYLHTPEKYQTEYFEAVRAHFSDIEKAAYILQTAHMDSVWSLTQQQITIVINDGKFDEVAKRVTYKE